MEYQSGYQEVIHCPDICLMIEQHPRERFIWMSYRRLEIAAVLPSSTQIHSHLWCINTIIINFQTIEWYKGDRVLRQFGCIQYIPAPPMQLGKIHKINKRGNMEIIGGCTLEIYYSVV
ncbi:hypothetical protein J1N35_022977 [Gossypium stocksii]|uniref:Aminotransferase-like plant mobile domain-containing protein n=1 Tax=Gossypium stocksii TaxID=47602 RepID=A0A9D3VHS4_9ROSI|nr:hypothetical protein J1N35_022977 [Gossypium stocksii]